MIVNGSPSWCTTVRMWRTGLPGLQAERRGDPLVDVVHGVQQHLMGEGQLVVEEADQVEFPHGASASRRTRVPIANSAMLPRIRLLP